MAGDWGVSPEHVRLSTAGTVRIRVHGKAWGRLRVGAVRRVVWGSFDESVLTRVGKRDTEIAVILRGVGGGRRTVSVTHYADVNVRLSELGYPRIRASVPVPRLRRVFAAPLRSALRLPRVTSLRRGDCDER